MGIFDFDLRNRTQVDQVNVDDYIARDIPEILTQPLPQSAVIARVVHFNERGGNAQQDWISQLVAGSTATAVSENYIASVSSVQHNFSLLIVSGNDPRRINKLLRLYRPILADKAKIAVLARSTPTERSLLLNGGYDDVFDLRTDLIEARARILGHIRRYHYRKIEDAGKSLRRVSGNNGQAGGGQNGVGRYFTHAPTPVEASIFSKLIASLDRPVLPDQLCTREPTEGEALSRRSLQVFICRIRKKLIPGLTIRFCGNEGYAASFHEPALKA